MTTFLQLTVQGIALGSIYAMIGLGFTVVLMAGVINFAQGSFMLVGAYIVSWLAVDMKLPFLLAIVIGVGLTAALGVAFEQLLLQRMSARPVFTVIMITLGVDIILRVITSAIWGYNERTNGDPFGLSGFVTNGVHFSWSDIWTVIVTLILLVIFFLFFKYSKYGVAMRAAATDREAAAAVGISLTQVYVLTWVLVGLLATIGGVFLAASPRVLDPTLGFTALRAFPAVILGGVGSPVGAVLGGLILGLVEVLVSGYQNQYFPWLGNGFNQVATYVVLLIVLLVRPYGLFGKKEVERV